MTWLKIIAGVGAGVAVAFVYLALLRSGVSRVSQERSLSVHFFLGYLLRLALFAGGAVLLVRLADPPGMLSYFLAFLVMRALLLRRIRSASLSFERRTESV